MSKKKTLQENDSKQYLVTTREGKKYLAFLRDEEKSTLVSQGATVEDPATGQNNTSSVMGEEQAHGDFLTLGMDLGKALAAALRDHGDSIEGLFLKNSSKDGCILRVRYRPDDDGAKWEDEFVIKYSGDPDAKAYLVNGEDKVELCPITQQSGSAQISKDLAKAAFESFINKKTDIGKSDIKASDPDVTGGQPINETEAVDISTLWEENGDKQFCEAARAWYDHKTKDGLKSLFRAARNFKKGNTIQEKFAGAVAWYKDPANRVKVDSDKKYYKNTKKQVFSGNGFADMAAGCPNCGAAVEEQNNKYSDGELADKFWDAYSKLHSSCLDMHYLASRADTEDQQLVDLSNELSALVDKFYRFYSTYFKPESLDECGDFELSISEAKVIEKYDELFKKFLNNFTLQELAETWEKIYPDCYNNLKDTVLYPYANVIEHILVMKGVISATDGKIVSRPWEEKDDYRGADVDENLNEAVDGISEEDIAEALKAFREVEQQGYQDPWFRGHAPGKVDLTCIAYNGDYKFIWDVPAEMDEEEVVTSTGKIYELDITFPNGKTINMNESSLEKRGFYNEEKRA